MENVININNPYNYDSINLEECKLVVTSNDTKIIDILSELKFNAIGYTGDEKQFYYDQLEEKILVVISKDEKYINCIKKRVFNNLKGFKVLNIDIDETISKEELEKFIYKTEDLKSDFEYHQDELGIFKYINPKKADEIKYDKNNYPIKPKLYITNFQITKVNTIKYTDKDMADGMEMHITNSEGKEFVKIGSVNALTDTKSFRNFLGSIDLVFKGKGNDLSGIQEMLYKYYMGDVLTLYKGNAMTDNSLITSNGAISLIGIDESIKANTEKEIIFNEIDTITSKEAEETLKHILGLYPEKYMYSILGSTIHGMATKLAEANNVRNTMLFILGQAGSGKSTILEKIISPLLGYTENNEAIKISSTTGFPLRVALGNNNYPVLLDEYKPSFMGNKKSMEFSNYMRAVYDRGVSSRGRKDMTSSDIRLTAPVIMAGEEDFYNEEKAMKDRFMTVYIGSSDRKPNGSEHIEWILNNQKIISKLGKSILYKILCLNEKYYKELYKVFSVIGKDLKFKDRVLDTYVKSCIGMDILNGVLEDLEIDKLNFIDEIADNVREMTGMDEDSECTEFEGAAIKMLRNFNKVIYDLKDRNGYYDNNWCDTNYLNAFLKVENDNVYINIDSMIDALHKRNKDLGITDTVLTSKDFKTQIKKAGIGTSKNKDGKQIQKNVGNTNKPLSFDIEILKKYNLNSLFD